MQKMVIWRISEQSHSAIITLQILSHMPISSRQIPSQKTY